MLWYTDIRKTDREEDKMTSLDLMQAKYEAMEKATTTQGRMLAHDAGNCAMMVVCSEMGFIKMAGKFFPSVN